MARGPFSDGDEVWLIVFLPAGDLARVAGSNNRTQYRTGQVAATVAFQELIFLTLMGLAILPGVAQYQRLGPLAAALVALLALIFKILLWEPAYRRAVALVRRTRLLRRFERDLQDLRGGEHRIRSGGVDLRRGLPGVGSHKYSRGRGRLRRHPPGFMALQGVSPSAGAAAAILYRGFNEVFMAGLGLFFLMRLPVQQRRHATASFRDEVDANQRPA